MLQGIEKRSLNFSRRAEKRKAYGGSEGSERVGIPNFAASL